MPTKLLAAIIGRAKANVPSSLIPGTECLPGLETKTGSIVGVVVMPTPVVVVVALTPSPAYAGEESELVLQAKSGQRNQFV